MRGVLTGFLAAAALGCSEGKDPPVAAQTALADSADQVIFGARQLLTDRGVLRAELLADTAFFFNEGTRIELRDVNTTFFNGVGAKNATLTSREGTYNTQLGQMAARKSVVVLSEDGRRLTTAELRFNEQTNLISSDSAFVATAGGRRLEGVGFESDPDMNNVRCKAACRGEAGAVGVPQSAASPGPAAPALPAAGSRPNTFVLPGQTVRPLPSTAPPSAGPAPASPAPASATPTVPPRAVPAPAPTPPAPGTPPRDTTA